MKTLTRHSRGVNFAFGLPNSKLPTFSAGGNDKVLNAFTRDFSLEPSLMEQLAIPLSQQAACGIDTTGLNPQQHTLRGKLLIIRIPAFAGMTDFQHNGKSRFTGNHHAA